MAVQVIASGITSDGVTASVAVTGPCSVFISGTMGSAEVTVEAAPGDGLFSVVNRTSGVDSFPPVIPCDLLGTNNIRVRVHNAGPTTNLTFKTNQ